MMEPEDAIYAFIDPPKWSSNAEPPEDNADWRSGYEDAQSSLREALKPWWPLGGPLKFARPTPDGEIGELVERAAIAKVWPKFVADFKAEHLSPRQIEMLYVASEWAHEAATALETQAADIARLREALEPFAKIYDNADATRAPDDLQYGCVVAIGALRKAHELLPQRSGGMIETDEFRTARNGLRITLFVPDDVEDATEADFTMQAGPGELSADPRPHLQRAITALQDELVDIDRCPVHRRLATRTDVR